jgi:hypothetical protein
METEMSNEKIHELLTELHKELPRTSVDDETRSLIQELESDIQRMRDADEAPTDSSTVLEKAQQLESTFATNHPAAERFMREIIDLLVKMGM